MPSLIESLPLPWIFMLFVLSGAVIAVMGTWLAGLVDQLADRTRLGEAITGGILLGATTSLPDIIVSVSAAATGYPEIAVSNALGGIAAQTVFLVAADLSYRQANLEHAAASATNMLSATLLLLLLAFPLVAATAPEWHLAAIHPVTPLAFLVYIGFQRMLARERDRPAWQPSQTAETVTDRPEARSDQGTLRFLWLRFGIAAATVASAGFVIAESGIALADRTGLSESLIGVVFTSLTTSAAELVTSIAAVRRGALTLAVSGIIGGNAFDALLVPMSDIAYREGSIYHAITRESMFLAAATLTMTIILLMGLLRREKSGIANIGFEGGLVLALYVGLVTILYFT
ncbi:sodium:calcium antiporter [Wenzhouxiangella sp. XN24]|uniref:sodium:calcium antiporter n=1 Tax=Wenzhouxiangella sp. XN24 TaxID=2713569 RepID=UPI0013EA1411|nr:sodium:calcium antiporter [Wenzhouxiangella sp. XN24]NGX15341.1 sodium:calcium antiporter [Wenzhouxiangella sp. XN24]